MSNFYNSVVNYLQPSGFKGHVVVKAPIVQIMSPAVQWNWSAAAAGQLPWSQLTFCDSIPQNAQGKNYVSSARSFSDGYGSFLDLINLQTFPVPLLVKQSIANNILPQHAATAAKGWAQTTNQAGLLEWKRVWNVSQSPQGWLAAISQNPQNDPVDLIFNDATLSIYAEDGTVLPIPQNTPIQITAKAIGRIQVSPDSWYNSSVVTIAGSNKNYFMVDPDVVFGNKGLINCRIAEFIVALKPEPSVTIDNSLIDPQSINQNPLAGISWAGFEFTSQDTFVDDSATVIGNVNFTLSPADAMRTLIKGNITGADLDNIFIIAVILETNTMSG